MKPAPKSLPGLHCGSRAAVALPWRQGVAPYASARAPRAEGWAAPPLPGRRVWPCCAALLPEPGEIVGLAGLLGSVAANLAKIACSNRAASSVKRGYGAWRARAAGVWRATWARAGPPPAARPFFASTATGLVQVVSFVSVFHQYVLPASSVTDSQPSAKGSLSSAICCFHEPGLCQFSALTLGLPPPSTPFGRGPWLLPCFNILKHDEPRSAWPRSAWPRAAY